MLGLDCSLSPWLAAHLVSLKSSEQRCHQNFLSNLKARAQPGQQWGSLRGKRGPHKPVCAILPPQPMTHVSLNSWTRMSIMWQLFPFAFPGSSQHSQEPSLSAVRHFPNFFQPKRVEILKESAFTAQLNGRVSQQSSGSWQSLVDPT